MQMLIRYVAYLIHPKSPFLSKKEDAQASVLFLNIIVLVEAVMLNLFTLKQTSATTFINLI